MNRMTLGGQRNRWYARQGRAATNAVQIGEWAWQNGLLKKGV